MKTILACIPSVTRVAGIISIGSLHDRPRFRSTAVGQNAYPASMHNYLKSGLSGQWVQLLGFRHVDIVRHPICFGDV